MAVGAAQGALPALPHPTPARGCTLAPTRTFWREGRWDGAEPASLFARRRGGGGFSSQVNRARLLVRSACVNCIIFCERGELFSALGFSCDSSRLCELVNVGLLDGLLRGYSGSVIQWGFHFT